MSTVAVVARPPYPGVVLQSLTETIGEDDAVELYEAMLGDVCEAVAASGGALLVNYAPREHLPESVPEDAEPKTAIQNVVAEAVPDPDTVRYEVQVGSTHAARVGNTVSHLLEREDASSVHVLEPTAPLVTRGRIDQASMKLRRNPIVVGPATDGRVYYAAFAEPIDFEDVFEPPEVETLVRRAVDDGLEVDFLQQVTPLETVSDLQTVRSLLRARSTASRAIPERTHDVLDSLSLSIGE